MKARVLLVEDEMLIAMDVADMLEELGFSVVGPALRLNKALRIAAEECFDLAVLDVNLAGERSFEVADVLRKRGIPFIFVTGYGVAGVIDDYREAVVLQKPIEIFQLGEAMAALKQQMSSKHSC